MPIIRIEKEEFYKSLGFVMSDDQLRELCFSYGLELDDITSEKEEFLKMHRAPATNGSS